MQNLIGDDVENGREIISDPPTRLHIHGKTETRAGRKMGHVTRLGAPFTG